MDNQENIIKKLLNNALKFNQKPLLLITKKIKWHFLGNLLIVIKKY